MSQITQTPSALFRCRGTVQIHDSNTFAPMMVYVDVTLLSAPLLKCVRQVTHSARTEHVSLEKPNSAIAKMVAKVCSSRRASPLSPTTLTPWSKFATSVVPMVEPVLPMSMIARPRSVAWRRDPLSVQTLPVAKTLLSVCNRLRPPSISLIGLRVVLK